MAKGGRDEENIGFNYKFWIIIFFWREHDWGIKMKRKFFMICLKKRTLPPQYAAFCKHMKKEK